MKILTSSLLVPLLSLALGATACDQKMGGVSKEDPAAKGTTAEPGGTVQLTGAGATFPYPVYSKWIAEYGKLDARAQINYQSIGSGAGIRQVTERTVDFGASDAPMSDAELKAAPSPIVHIPTLIGSVVVAYNLKDAPAALKLDADTLTAIYMGEVKTWNDPKLAALNPDAKLPADPITVIYRSDGSGTTAVFTDYLAKVSPAWKDKVGAGKSVKFPAGLGAKGNEGVAGQVKTTPGAIGYVELAYAMNTGLAYAHLKNASGAFVEPTVASVTAAAAGVTLPDDLRVSITNAAGAEAYPIASFTYLLVYQEAQDAAKARVLGDFLWWAVHDGQAFVAPLHDAPLPAAVVTQVEAKLRTLTAAGKPLLAK